MEMNGMTYQNLRKRQTDGKHNHQKCPKNHCWNDSVNINIDEKNKDDVNKTISNLLKVLSDRHICMI